MRLKPPKELVEILRDDLERLKSARAAQPKRKQRRKAYKDFIKACDAMIGFVETPVSPYRTDGGRTLPHIAELISATGFGRLLGVTQWSVSRLPHEGLGRDVRNRSGRDNDSSEDALTLDRQTFPRRADLAIQAGPVLVQKLIGEIKEPVRRLLKIEGRGGRPPDAERRHVIRLARLNFRHLANKEPTKDEGGEFVLFCQDLCAELGLPADTLGSLVADVLRKRPRVRKRSKAAT